MPESLFEDFSPSLESHFRIHFLGALLPFIHGVATSAGSMENAFAQFPFLVEYNNKIAQRLDGLSSADAFQLWAQELKTWENNVKIHLPLRALGAAFDLLHEEMMWLLLPGFVEEDSRFGLLCESLEGSLCGRRPTLHFLRQCWPGENGDPLDLLLRLQQMGILELANAAAARSEWIFKFPPPIWDALRSGQLSSNRHQFRTADAAPALNDLVLPAAIRKQFESLPSLLKSGRVNTVIVRGPRHNGRRTCLASMARSMGLGVIEPRPVSEEQTTNSNELTALGLLLNAMPIAEIRVDIGESIQLPVIESSLPFGVVTGLSGGFTGPRADRSVVIQLDLPDLQYRRALWGRSLSSEASADIISVASHFRITSGNIARVAALACTNAAVEGRDQIALTDLHQATRSVENHGLESCARRLPPAGPLRQLAAGERTLADLDDLARRCRQRESLPDALTATPGGRLNYGVRALFTGPSGTGKSLAARMLAGSLDKEIFSVNLASIVDRYVGESTKRLNRVFDFAEEIDVILLLDEGDAFLARRTDVQSSTDRYANLETNFLLQRLESFQGILIVTTNARDRIDSAFERRMDVVVEFLAPAPDERWQLWQTHLPATHAVPQDRLAEVASECELTGGQIHNAVLHATLLALDDGGIVTAEYLHAAVQREYRKRAGICPLRR
jgi:ATP-dependent 26S proteasome regulatory subunit